MVSFVAWCLYGIGCFGLLHAAILRFGVSWSGFFVYGWLFMLLGLVFALFLLRRLRLAVLGASETCGFDFCSLLTWCFWVTSGVWTTIRLVSYGFGVLGGVACFRRCLLWWC